MNLDEQHSGREAHGFCRTVCACAFCAAPCRYVPGSLDREDLERLCPPGQDVFSWAEQHLRAVTDKPFPTLVPARGPDGACHWFFGGKCTVHEAAPYSCAFFDAHMSEEEVRHRSVATVRARRADSGLYARVWNYLRERGLTCPSGDRAALEAEWHRLARVAVRRPPS